MLNPTEADAQFRPGSVSVPSGSLEQRLPDRPQRPATLTSCPRSSRDAVVNLMNP